MAVGGLPDTRCDRVQAIRAKSRAYLHLLHKLLTEVCDWLVCSLQLPFYQV